MCLDSKLFHKMLCMYSVVSWQCISHLVKKERGGGLKCMSVKKYPSEMPPKGCIYERHSSAFVFPLRTYVSTLENMLKLFSLLQTQCCVLLQLYNAVVHTVHSITVLVLYLRSTSKGVFVVYMANTTVCLLHHHGINAKPWQTIV